MAIRNGKIPESLFFNQANPELKLDQSPFYVNTVTSAWSSKGKPRIAGISSFGVGGTNAHAILAQAPSTDFRPSLRPCSLLVLSARTETVLDLTTKNLGRHFAEHPDISLADTAYTLQLGRKHFEHRRILVCSDVGTVVNTFHSPDFKQSYTGKVPPLNQDVVFMFTGQGSQYVNMAKEIYHHIPVVNKEINRCAEILRPILNQDIRDIWFSPSSASETAQTSLDETLYTQTVLFTLEYALAKFWMSVGITPAAMIGHSIGEYVAACLAGVFSLETALKIVFIRGREMQRQPAGAMLAVQISESDIKPLLTDGLTLAAVNSPAQCVLSGPVPEIDRLHAALKAGHGPNGQQVFCSRLHTSHAYHSAMMAPAAQALVDTLKTIDLQPPTIPFISNLTGLTITPEQAMDPEYWGLHLTQTVRFSKGIQTLLESPDRTFLEIGPGRTLTAFAQVHFESPNALPALSSIPHPKQQASDYAFLLTTLGRLWINGCRIDWTGYWGEEPRMRIPLPTYPFERQRHWIDAAEKFTAQSKRSTFLGSILERFSFYLPLKQRSGRTKSGSAPFDPGRINDPSFDAVETELARLWQKVLGVKQVSGEDDFFESGGHSLLAAQLFAEIETTFGKNIPISTLYHSSTFSKLAAMLKDRDMNTEWTSLVPIRPGGIKLPLYLVHGAEGNVLLYRALVLHLDAERPVYGMQSAGLDGTKGFDPDFKKVAGNYIKEIKTVQPEGPYLMGGYCLGGVIALEMAQQLIAMGDTVIFLGMIEIYNIQTLNWPLPLYLRLYNSSLNVWYHLLNMISSRNEAKLDFFKEKVQTEYRRLRVWLRMRLARLLSLTGIRTQAIYHHQRVDKAYDKALEAYFPVKYPGVITVFGAKKLPAGFTDPDTYGFGGIAEKGVDIHILPVYPRGTLVEPYVKILAEKLDMAMAGAEKTIYNGQTRA
jgi:malonyl CoA-acyl carrier protein transacylase/acyl carrier protein